MEELEQQIKENKNKYCNVVRVNCHKFENSLIDLHEKTKVYDGHLLDIDQPEKSWMIPKGQKTIDSFFI